MKQNGHSQTQIELQLLRAENKQLRQMLAEREHFFAGMGHELRTPLNTILGVAEVLQEGIYGELDANHLRLLGTVERSGRELLTLINDIMEVLKVEVGSLSPTWQPVSAETITRATLKLIKNEAHKHQIRLTSKVSRSAEMFVSDPTYLKRALFHLLDYMLALVDDGGRLSLEVGTNSERTAIEARVKGSPVQADSVAIRQQLRTAGLLHYQDKDKLGLTVAMQLVRLIEGRISVVSAENKSIALLLSLPIEIGESATQAVPEGVPFYQTM